MARSGGTAHKTLRRRKEHATSDSRSSGIRRTVGFACTCVRIVQFLIRVSRHFYCDMEPPENLMQFFRKRGDKQITSLEILAIALGISTFSNMIANRRLIVFSDNVGAERSTQKGTSTLCHCVPSSLDNCFVRLSTTVRSGMHRARDLAEARGNTYCYVGYACADEGQHRRRSVQASHHCTSVYCSRRHVTLCVSGNIMKRSRG